MKPLIYIRFVSVIILIAASCIDLMGRNLKPMIYLIPGQGSDYRIFENLQFDSAFEIKNVFYSVPEKEMTLRDYAIELSKQIDTNRPFILIGVSLGGMIATEMGDFLDPEKIILISSAKCREELPKRYKFQRDFPIYKIIPSKTAKRGAQILQPIVEPDRKHEKETFKSMLRDKDPEFLKQTIKMIMEWDRVDFRKDIIHIHGDNDKTIPIRNVKYDYLLKNGSHMMALTRGDEISILINEILLK